MLALIAVIASLVSFVLTSPPRNRKGLTKAAARVQRNHQDQADARNASARRQWGEAAALRKQARVAARNLALYQWGAVFYSDTHPTLAANYSKHISGLGTRVATYLQKMELCEKAAAAHAALAAEHQKQADRLEPRPRRQSDLLLLARVCWEGARRARIRRLESSRVS